MILFTATQAQNQRASFLEPNLIERENLLTEDIIFSTTLKEEKQEPTSTLNLIPPAPLAFDLQNLLLALSRQAASPSQKFKLFINKPDLYQNFDFLENWTAFVQKLFNIFGSYSPEDDNKNAIVAIPFPNNKKAVTYFIYFIKYQNHIQWDDCFLQKVVKDTLSNHIRDELQFSQENVLSFKGLKKVVLKINNDYWKCQQKEKSKAQVTYNLPSYLPKPQQIKTNRALYIPEELSLPDWWSLSRPWPMNSISSPMCLDYPQAPANNILGPDGQLTVVMPQVNFP